jgi:hypothetical protein
MHPGMMQHGYFVPGGVHPHPMMQMQPQSGDGQQQYQPQNAQQFHQQHRSPQMIGAMQQQSAQIMNQNPQGGHHQNPQIDQKAGLIKLMQQQIKVVKIFRQKFNIFADIINNVILKFNSLFI